MERPPTVAELLKALEQARTVLEEQRASSEKRIVQRYGKLDYGAGSQYARIVAALARIAALAGRK